MNAPNSDMLLETLIARTIGGESVLTMGALLASPVPPGVHRYLHAEICNRLAEDLSHAPHFARVASPTAGADAIRDALLRHAAGQYIFPREEFLGMLENAARFTENYLCRPRWTLSSFLFLDQPAITAEMLLRKLEYVADYAYLPQLLRRMVTRSGKQVITSHECIAHITRIDDAVIREHSPRERALLATPIFQFFLLSPDVENKPISLRALLLFLEDKQFGPLREYAEGVWRIRGKSEITMEEYVALNEDFAVGRSSFAPAPTVAEPPPELFPEPAKPEAPPLAAELQKSTVPGQQETGVVEPVEQVAGTGGPGLQETGAAEPAHQETGSAEPAQQDTSSADPARRETSSAEPAQQDTGSAEPAQQDTSSAEPVQRETSSTELAQQEIGSAAPALQDTGSAEPVQRETSYAEPAQQETSSAAPAQQDTSTDAPARPAGPPLLSLKETIPGNLRRRFINVICGKDAEFYDLVIARLDEMYSWPEASTYIRELFEINSIDPFNDTAIAFTDVIQKRCDRSRAAEQ